MSPCAPDRVGSISRNGRGRYRLGVGVIRGVRAVAQCEVFSGEVWVVLTGFGRWDTEGWLGRWEGEVEVDGGDVGY